MSEQSKQPNRRISPEEYRQQQFVESTPIGSAVWSDAGKHSFGYTRPGRIYSDPFDSYVAVDYVDGRAGMTGVWMANHVKLMTGAELSERGLRNGLPSDGNSRT